MVLYEIYSKKSKMSNTYVNGLYIELSDIKNARKRQEIQLHISSLVVSSVLQVRQN